MQYKFKTKVLDEQYIDEIATIVEKYVEIKSREKYPKVWNKLDKIKPNEGKNRNDFNLKLLGIISFLLGGFLIYKGIILNINILAIISGIILLFFSLLFFYSLKKHSFDRRFNDSAREYLKQRNNILGKIDNNELIFDENSFKFIESSKRESTNLIGLKYVILSDNLIGLFFEKEVLILQNDELINGDIMELSDYFKKYINVESL